MFNKKRTVPLLCALLLLLTLVMPAIPAQAAADTAIIKAGTYRFNDVLSNPNDVIGDGGSVTCFFQSNVNMQLTEEDAANLEVFASQYNISGPIPPAGSYHLVVSCYGFYTITDNNFYYLVNGATCEHYSEIFSAYVWALSSQGRYGVYYQDRWLDTQYQTITILEDTEVSAEFAEWFAANASPVTSTSTIKAGTYRFNDVLSAPSADIEQSLNFTTLLPVDGSTLSCTEIRANAWGTGVAVAITFDGEINSIYSTDDGGWDFYANAGMPEYNQLGKTITIPNDTEVSAEFAEWFAANTIPVKISPGVDAPGLSPGGSDDFVAVMDVFDSVGNWLSGAVDEAASIFYVDGQMTFLGEVAIACVCISFALLVLFLISKWLHFK